MQAKARQTTKRTFPTRLAGVRFRGYRRREAKWPRCSGRCRRRLIWSLTSDPALRLPFLLVFDVAADDVGDIGVLFFLFLDKGVVVVERVVQQGILFAERWQN